MNVSLRERGDLTIHPLPPMWRERALVLSGVTAPAEWFSDQELEEASRFSRPKRREEWLASRAAAKQLALQRGLCLSPRECLIDRPRIRIAGSEQFYVALSHSREFCAAAMDLAPIGIDVEALREVDERMARFFLTEEEAASLENTAINHRLLHFWTAKEAAWKRLQGEVTTLKQVALVLIEERENGLLFDQAETWAIDGAIVALTHPTS
ncbi:MAG TPA: 4'-phosphopantetheinyl transferase superfamily protein [Thermoanaerobaculia bacterium]|nr:4'-phosphopantetheinyl transferase superfamily protein [Thermoanaerobaculia bacterium]